MPEAERIGDILPRVMDKIKRRTEDARNDLELDEIQQSGVYFER